MADLENRIASIRDQLPALAARFDVPGASLAVSFRGERFETATGLVSRTTGVEVDPDTVFQIGSITKLLTGSLVLQLVAEGRVELDEPVATYLPELQLGDAAARESITIRHLLTHSSGIDGDFFEDTGRGDDAIERYVVACAALPSLHPPGEGFSYCNAGFVLLGRVIEKLRGQPFRRVLRERVFEAAGMVSSGSLPEEAILYRAAVGHIDDPENRDAPMVATKRWMLAHSNAAAGATPFATARDLLAFAETFLGGEAPSRLYPEALREQAWTAQTALPPNMAPSAWGLAWMLFDWGGKRVVGHDGGTIGQASFLRLLPVEGLAVALLTNGGKAPLLYRAVFDGVFRALAGVTMPPPPEVDPGFAIDASRYAGTYGRLSNRYEVVPGDGNSLAVAQQGLRGPFRASEPVSFVLRAVDERQFLVVEGPGAEFQSRYAFTESDDGGRYRGFHAGSRLNVRQAPG